MNNSKVVHACPSCHMVLYGNDYDNALFCVCCGELMDNYKEEWLSEWWINNEVKQHEEWEIKRNMRLVDANSIKQGIAAYDKESYIKYGDLLEYIDGLPIVEVD